MNKWLCSILLVAAAMLANHSSAQAQVMFIANPGLKGADYTTADLRDVFSGNSSTLKGSGAVGPVLLKQGALHEEFLNRYIGKSDAAFRASWRSLVFSGQGVMPRTLESEAAVVDYVAHTPGAIGYITRATPHDGVKTLVVR